MSPVTRIAKKPREICDCDLSFDDHPMNRDHFRACKAPYENAELTGIVCQVIRDHKGPHKAEVINWIEWSEGAS